MKIFQILLLAVIITACSYKEDKEQPKYVNANVALTQLMEEKALEKKDIRIEISKSDYTLYLMHDSEIVKSYPVVLGPDPVNDKFVEGDGCTPEGVFGIRDKYPHKKWCRFIWLDYPNEQSWKKHKMAEKEGTIPRDSEIGGEVGIHGVPEGRDDLIDKGTNWTLGCISLKNNDIIELYKFIDRDMKIYIRK